MVNDSNKSANQSDSVLPVIALILALVASFNSVFASIYTEYLFKNTPGLSFGQQQVSIATSFSELLFHTKVI
jgi:hypothetical protein